MATTNVQMASIPLPSDIPVQNWSSSADIPPNTAVQIDTSNLISNSTAAGHAGIAVKLPTEGGDPSLCIGITMDTIPKNGGTGRVRGPGGIALAVADGVITGGTTVDASAGSAKAGQVKAHTAAKAQIGIALTTAADQDTIPVLVIPALDA